MNNGRLEHRLLREHWKSVTPQVLDLVGSPDSAEKHAMAAVLDSPPGAILSHDSSAALWGIPGFRLAEPFHVTIPRQGIDRRSRLAIVHYQKDLPLRQVEWLRSIPVASPALTMFHLAATNHPARVERALDNAWSMRLLDGRVLEQLLDQLARRGRNGIRLMRELISARAGDFVPPESGNEVRYLVLLDEAGLPLPRQQVAIGADFVVGRVDFLFGEVNGIVEILSRRYHTAKLDRESDERRFESLGDAGMKVLTIWDDEIWQKPGEVVARTRRFLLDLGHPRVFSRGKHPL
jgi:very-short-patch-repair endonuclease